MMPADELAATVEAIQAYAENYHAIAKGVVAQFLELSKAVEPLMLACKDQVVLVRFLADLQRIGAAVAELTEKGRLH